MFPLYSFTRRVIHLCVLHSPNASISHSAIITGRSGKSFPISRVTMASLHRLEALSYSGSVHVKLGLWPSFTHMHIRPL